MKPTKLTDEAILTKAKKLRDGPANTLVGGVLGCYLQDARYLHVARGILHNHEDAEDAVSDAVVLALRKWRQYRGDAKFSTWFTRIVITCALMTRRSRQDHISDIPERWLPQRLDDEIYLAEVTAMLREAVGHLADPAVRAILKMRVEDGLTFRAISKQMRRPLGTVKNLALEGYRCLQDELADESPHQNNEGNGVA
jgi:RNA polymerase sigma-70 factor, ECF subfamily